MDFKDSDPLIHVSDTDSTIQKGAALNLLESMWSEMRREVETIARARQADPGEPTAFPDPVTLNAIERRVLVKSVFSFIEALAFCMKAWALAESTGKTVLTDAEKALAGEQSHELTERGGPVTRRARLRTLSNLRFSFHVLGKATASSFQLDVSGAGWQHLRDSLVVRDRLMHPKKVADLHVTDEEIRGALQTFIWFESQFTLLLVSVVRALQAEVSRQKQVQSYIESTK
jgi:hypothetical protein